MLEGTNLIQAESNEAVKKWDKPIDLLFIDGDHSYQGVSDDFNNFTPFLKSGCRVYFHDCDMTSRWVVRFFNELKWNKALCRDEMDQRNTSMAWAEKP